MTTDLTNPVTASLAGYPLEELGRLVAQMRRQGLRIFNFGAGDARLPTWPAIRQALRDAVPEVSVYPGIRGLADLHDAQLGYLSRRFGLASSNEWAVAPCLGSREAIFHIALCLVGRGGRRRLLFPDPGYPVYGASASFAGGIPGPVDLVESNGYLLEPWRLPPEETRDVAAVWVNHPGNPTGATASRPYWERLVDWAHQHDVVILSDESYVDIYDDVLDAAGQTEGADRRPTSPLTVSTDRVLSFYSLSKRSGLAGYRSGFVAGDARLVDAFVRARSFFGLAAPEFIDRAAAVAWQDDAHVAARRQVFSSRMRKAVPLWRQMGLLASAPPATFYLWCRVPERFGGDDAAYARALAARGVLVTPARWLGSRARGYVRFALVLDEADIEAAAEIIDTVVP